MVSAGHGRVPSTEAGDPTWSGGLVGRQREMEALVGGFDEAVSGRGRLFLVRR